MRPSGGRRGRLMLTAVLSVVLTLVVTLPATAVEVERPQGARWLMAAPSASAFAAQVSAWAQSAGRHSPSLTEKQLGQRLLDETGLPLLSVDALSKTGMDTARSWLLFRRAEATYLAVHLRDEKAFAASQEARAAVRLLKGREAQTASGGRRIVTFSRHRGSRAAAGYVLASDRAVLLVDAPNDRPHGLSSAMEALLEATPLAADVEGGLLVWFDPAPEARDVWLGLSGSAEGLRLTGSARFPGPARSRVDAGWITSLVASGTATGSLRLRVLAGDGLAGRLARFFTQATGPMDAPVMTAVARAAQGAAEVRVAPFSPASRRATGPDALFEMLSPVLVLPGRADAQQAVREAAKRATGRFGVRVDGRDLQLGLGTFPTRASTEVDGKPLLSCAKGRPELSLRLESRALAGSLAQVGLLDLFGSELLAGLFAVRTEYGPLLKASQPLIVLGCRAGDRVRMQGRWLFDGK